MKTKSFIFFCLFLLTCKNQPLIYVEVPWYISLRISNDRSFDYHFSDSLAKFELIDIDRVQNKGQFYSYLANLHLAVQSENIKQVNHFIDSAFKSDSINFCKKLILPTYEYLKPNGRPYRRFTMPYLLDYDLNYFLRMLERCQSCCIKIDDDLIHNGYKNLSLSIAYLILRDQWFRIPKRSENPDLQTQFDIENRAFLDQLYQQYPLPKADKDIRSDIYVLLLHSEDCKWSEKWLRIYMDTYRGYERYEKHLKHFLWRSSCANDRFKKIIEEELNK